MFRPETRRPARPDDLRGWRPLADLSDADLAPLVAAGQVAGLPAQRTVCVQGAMPEHLHVLLDGRASLAGVSPDGEEIVVDFRERGGCFVLAAVMAEAPYLMTARTLVPSEVLLLDSAALRAQADRVPTLGARIAAVLAAEFRCLVEQIHGLKQRTLIERLADYLLALSGDAPAEGAGRRIELPVGKRLLATKLGTRPESLSRAFAQLRDAGVRTSGATVEIDDLGRLRDMSRGIPG